MKTPEYRKMIGRRNRDMYGNAYIYGLSRNGDNRSLSSATKKAIRSDKRSVKAKEMKRIMKDNDEIV